MGMIGDLPADSVYNSYGENIKSVYYKIEGVFVDTEKEKVRVTVRGWLSEFARHNQGIGVFKRVFYIPIAEFDGIKLSKDTLVKKSYEYISKLPEFANARNSFKEYAGEVVITKETRDQQEKDLEQLINELKQ